MKSKGMLTLVIKTTYEDQGDGPIRRTDVSLRRIQHEKLVLEDCTMGIKWSLGIMTDNLYGDKEIPKNPTKSIFQICTVQCAP